MKPPEDCPLSQPEWECVLATFARGRRWSSAEVGKALHLSGSTVRTHLSNARRTLRRADMEGVRRLVIQRGWVGESGAPRQRRDLAARDQYEPLSPALKAYNAAFDELLANWRDEETVAYAREQMRHHLAGEVLCRRLSPELVRGSRRPNESRTIRSELPAAVLPGLVVGLSQLEAA